MFSLGTVFSLAAYQSLPATSQIQFSSGRLTSLKYLTPVRGSKSVRFQLINGNWFQFSSKAGDVETVYQALQSNEGDLLRVGYVSSFSGSPIGDDREFYNVLSLEVGSMTVRTYPQIMDAWNGDNQLAMIMGKGLFIGSGLLLLIGSIVRVRGQ